MTLCQILFTILNIKQLKLFSVTPFFIFFFLQLKFHISFLYQFSLVFYYLYFQSCCLTLHLYILYSCPQTTTEDECSNSASNLVTHFSNCRVTITYRKKSLKDTVYLNLKVTYFLIIHIHKTGFKFLFVGSFTLRRIYTTIYPKINRSSPWHCYNQLIIKSTIPYG